MYGTMQDFPLTITAILRHATGVHGARRVITATGGGFRDCTYYDLGGQAAQLANALRGLGITADQRVATFMWNNQEHLAAYLADTRDGRGAAHPQHPAVRRADRVHRQRGGRSGCAGGHVVWPRCWLRCLPQLETVHTVIAVGDQDIAPLEESGKVVLRYAELIGGETTEFDWPQVDENSAAAMCYTSGTTGNPKGVVYSHRSSYLHTMASLYRQRDRHRRERPRAAHRADVSCQRMGSAVCGVDGGSRPGAARPSPGSRSGDRHDRAAAAEQSPAQYRRSGTTSCITWRKTLTMTCRHCGWSSREARPCRYR